MKQMADLDAKWSVPESFDIAYSELSGEPEVASVCLRLGSSSKPGWVLRRPRDFLVGLFERWTALDAERLTLVNEALCSLLRAQPGLQQVRAAGLGTERRGCIVFFIPSSILQNNHAT